MSASEIIKELPKLSEAERRAVLKKLRELARRRKTSVCATKRQTSRPPNSIAWRKWQRIIELSILRSRRISEAQASDLRARLKTFAEDWDRPEAAIYDEDPAR